MALSTPYYLVETYQLEQGKLSLDDKLEKFFPGFPSGDKITIEFEVSAIKAA